MPSILMTGYPGFLGSSLLPRVLSRRHDATAVCLVQSKFTDLAAEHRSALVTRDSSLAGRIHLVEGDITSPTLVHGGATLPGDIDEIYHLAAVYDLSVSAALARSVNVDGTRHVLDFAKECASLNRMHYVSTCYVSGRHPGVFGEEDLHVGQSFNNHYEETKYRAEAEVQQAMSDGLPTTIYRPAVVVGESTTGETQKYDGPYFFLRLIMRQRHVALVPVVGNTRRAHLNLVPRDFVTDAIAYLSGLAKSENRVYQLADPDPPTVHEVADAFATAVGCRLISVRLPRTVARWSTRHVPGVYRLTGVPAEAIDYFAHPTTYDTSNTTADLEESGIAVPRFVDYADTLVRFVEAHPEVGSKAMA
ncbi:MAG: SDR family oxidoreductase [Gemmatimonadota bacterium]|nr:MAG: SDR family oxidoreductase [Gemmatimonadota bacterium]